MSKIRSTMKNGYENYIKDILKYEKDIIKALSNFVTIMLKEIQNSEIPLKEKISLGESLISSTCYNIKGTRDILDLIKEKTMENYKDKDLKEDTESYEDKEIKSVKLNAGEYYPLSISSQFILDSIEVIWEDEGKGAVGKLIIDNVDFGEKKVSDNLGCAIWNNLNTLGLKARIEISKSEVQVLSAKVNYKVSIQNGN